MEASRDARGRAARCRAQEGTAGEMNAGVREVVWIPNNRKGSALVGCWEAPPVWISSGATVVGHAGGTNGEERRVTVEGSLQWGRGR